MAIQRQVSNIQAGDIVIWRGDEDLSGPLPDTMGMVIDTNPNSYDEQGVLIQFFGGDDFHAGPLHYYHRELELFLEKGEIRIQHG
ncbi:MAG: hypothetical protein HN345_10185 [Planctomycetaceae bacterium]|jgi:uncharacterized protein YijF (DUF1287 family)|nr:hypothetical protein [Planctomycetaceae bacterium]